MTNKNVAGSSNKQYIITVLVRSQHHEQVYTHIWAILDDLFWRQGSSPHVLCQWMKTAEDIHWSNFPLSHSSVRRELDQLPKVMVLNYVVQSIFHIVKCEDTQSNINRKLLIKSADMAQLYKLSPPMVGYIQLT